MTGSKKGGRDRVTSASGIMSYPFAEIEKKWQAFWDETACFRTPTDRTRPKYYVLDMFPYPSGAGLHVGHPEGYTATDIMARYKRMQGFNVLHPMGWDAFGLPAERYAMQTGIHPSETTRKNIDNFRRQLKALGFSYDWEREISTTHEKYYRWTQWIFLKIFNSFYDYKAGKARPITELKIPADIAADADKKEAYVNEHRLAYITDAPVNWCAELGTVLANEEVDEWVDKGYKVERKPMRQWMLRITAYAERLLDDLEGLEWPTGTMELQKNWIGRSEGAAVNFTLENSKENLTVFTTRPDTLFGVSYMVLAPEHPLVEQVTSKAQMKAVQEYQQAAAHRSERDRTVQGEKAEKTGVFTGGYAIHPINGEKIPIWIADYVLMSYGTGAIMAVPAHDERDFAFAKAFNLPIKTVIEPAKEKARKKFDPDNLSDAFTAHGRNINSDFLDGLSTEKAIARMIAYLQEKKLGEGQTNYKLRDWLFSRQRYWGEPMPISFDEQGHFVAASEEELPLSLPPSDDFQPAVTGESPLARLKDWINYSDKAGRKLRRESNTMPQWAGSCWYYLRYIDPTNDERLVGEAEEAYWMNGGVDLYVGGAEHAVLHLLYARFWHKILFDLGVISTNEPFQKLVHQGLILGEDGKKMSKSLGNVVNPDDVVSKHGADAFRMYEMFMGPLEQSKPWKDKNIEGVVRFLNRVWRLYTEDKKDHHVDTVDPRLLEDPADEDRKSTERVVHQTIQKVTQDIESLSFNTAISQMMIFINEVHAKKAIGKAAAENFVLLLAPFAPHIAEELWQRLGHQESLTNARWPSFDASKTISDEIEVVYQVNGKLRGKEQVPASIEEDDLKSKALAHEAIQRAVEGKEIRKVIVVKKKLVNIVV